MFNLYARSTLSSDARISRRVLARFVGAKGIGVGQTIEEGQVRIHRYSMSLRITDLTNAGKRGKKCKQVSVRGPASVLDEIGSTIDSMHSMAQVEAALKKILSKFDPHDREVEMDTDELRGVDVMPGGFAPLLIRGIHVTVEVGYKDFTVTDVADEDVNGTKCIPKGKGADVPAFYRWVKDNQKKIQTMTFGQITKEMEALGIKYHQYCSID